MVPKIKLQYAKFRKYMRKLKEAHYAKKDSLSVGINEKVLFVDLGANLGQAYYWFKKFFNTPNIQYEIFEPNPHCVEHLKAMDDVMNGSTILHPVGVGSTEGSFDFFGLSENEGGKYSQGGSIVQKHNSQFYNASSLNTVRVKIINFSDYLREKSKAFDRIVVKMDIEGEEVELLEDLIESRNIDLINILYVEFHAQYQHEKFAAATVRREKKILKALRQRPSLSLRIWH